MFAMQPRGSTTGTPSRHEPPLVGGAQGVSGHRSDAVRLCDGGYMSVQTRNTKREPYCKLRARVSMLSQRRFISCKERTLWRGC